MDIHGYPWIAVAMGVLSMEYPLIVHGIIIDIHGRPLVKMLDVLKCVVDILCSCRSTPFYLVTTFC